MRFRAIAATPRTQKTDRIVTALRHGALEIRVRERGPGRRGIDPCRAGYYFLDEGFRSDRRYSRRRAHSAFGDEQADFSSYREGFAAKRVPKPSGG